MHRRQTFTAASTEQSIKCTMHLHFTRDAGWTVVFVGAKCTAKKHRCIATHLKIVCVDSVRLFKRILSWCACVCVCACTLANGERTSHIIFYTSEVQIYRIIGQVFFILCIYIRDHGAMHYENKVAVALSTRHNNRSALIIILMFVHAIAANEWNQD